MSYSDWLQRQISLRRQIYKAGRGATQFSLLTAVYERTDTDLFLQTKESVFAQIHTNWEWLILAHGPINRILDTEVDVLSHDPRCRVLRLEENLGPMGGLRFCLAAARGKYIVPMDADDLITADALAILDSYITANDGPGYLFSDEDHLFGDTLCYPWFRPGFDPVLLKASSYIWHLAVFQRDAALTLGVYEDRTAEWCHDWDTALRFATSGHFCVHVPHVLYHWRHHEKSSTNTSTPNSGSLLSQKSVLERQIRLQAEPGLFEVAEFPLYRGATEYAITRREIAPANLEVLIYGGRPAALGDSAAAAVRTAEHPISRLHIVGARLANGDLRRLRDLGSPEIVEHGTATVAECLSRLIDTGSTWVAILSERVTCNMRKWAWACDGLFRIHPEVMAVGGRLLDARGEIIAANEIFGFDGIVGSPDAQRQASDPGYFALALKPHCCSAPYSELAAVRTKFLPSLADSLPVGVSWPSIGLWIGAEAQRKGGLVAYTPLFSAVAIHENASERFRVTSEEARLFGRSYSVMVPDTRWYSRNHQWVRNGGYQLRTGEPE